MWPNVFRLGTSSMPTAAQASSSDRICAAVSGEASRQASSWPGQANVCST
jgi:hypothetical protein